MDGEILHEVLERIRTGTTTDEDADALLGVLRQLMEQVWRHYD